MLLQSAENNAYGTSNISGGIAGSTSGSDLGSRPSLQLQKSLQRLGTFDLIGRTDDDDFNEKKEEKQNCDIEGLNASKNDLEKVNDCLEQVEGNGELKI